MEEFVCARKVIVGQGLLRSVIFWLCRAVYTVFVSLTTSHYSPFFFRSVYPYTVSEEYTQRISGEVVEEGESVCARHIL